MGASDADPGPQVPPAAGGGRAMKRPEMASPAPNRPTNRNANLTHT